MDDPVPVQDAPMVKERSAVSECRVELWWFRAGCSESGSLRRCRGDGEMRPVMVGGRTAVHALMDLDASPDVASPAVRWEHLEMASLEAHQVVASRGAHVFEAEDGGEVEVRVGSAVRAFGLSGRQHEFGVVARQEASQHPVRCIEVSRIRQAQFGDQPALKRAPEAFDAPLDLGRVGRDRDDAKLIEGSAHLGQRPFSLQLGVNGVLLSSLLGDTKRVCLLWYSVSGIPFVLTMCRSMVKYPWRSSWRRKTA